MVQTSDDVARYYEANTGTFLRFGVGRRARVIHRAVWGPGVEKQTEALHFVHDRLLGTLEELGGRETQRVLDLGCGTGSSLIYLIEQGVGLGAGVNNSPAQLAIFKRRIRDQGLEDRLEAIEADFCELPDSAFPHDAFDLVFAIESFSHAVSAEAFFDRAHRFLRPGGRLVIVDDVVASDPKRAGRQSQTTPGAEPLLSDFRRGWQLSSLIERRTLHKLARRHRLETVAEEDLTALLRSNPIRQAVVAGAARLGRSLTRTPVGSWLEGEPRWLNLLGGDALQRLLSLGVVQYRMHTWRKP